MLDSKTGQKTDKDAKCYYKTNYDFFKQHLFYLYVLITSLSKCDSSV